MSKQFSKDNHNLYKMKEEDIKNLIDRADNARKLVEEEKYDDALLIMFPTDRPASKWYLLNAINIILESADKIKWNEHDLEVALRRLEENGFVEQGKLRE